MRCTSPKWLWLLAAVSCANGKDDSPELTTDSECSCYQTNSSTAAYFSHHSFVDFRQLSEFAVGSAPRVLTDQDDNADAPATSTFFTVDNNFTRIWAPQSWDNSRLMRMNNSDESGSDATVLMVNTLSNLYIEKAENEESATFLTMRTARASSKLQTAAEMETLSKGFQFLSIRMRARTIGSPGAVTAMFTYRADDSDADDVQKVQETDLEIRTLDPSADIQLTNQPSWNEDGDVPEATRNATMPKGQKYTDWVTYRIDWTPGKTTWYVDGEFVATIEFQAPKDPAQVMFNNWSDGGSWSGEMPQRGAAYMQIQWIDMVFNNTDNAYKKSGQCDNVCSVDETPEVGTPVLLSSSGGMHGHGDVGWGLLAVVVLAQLFLLV